MDFDTVTVDDMKKGLLGELCESLTHVLQAENVLAVVGPSITEASLDVLNAIRAVVLHRPILLECSGAAHLAGFREADVVPGFRINSTIEQRAHLTAQMISAAVDAELEVAVLVEQQGLHEPKSYGEYLLSETIPLVTNWRGLFSAGKIHTHRFDGSDEKSLAGLSDKLVDTPKLLLVLGMGYHIRAVADRHFRVASSEKSKQLPILAGWMAAYAYDGIRDDVRTDRIIELTDLDLSVDSSVANASGLFKSQFGELTPALRDTAFSFDAGVVCVEAFQQLCQKLNYSDEACPWVDEVFLSAFVQQLRETQLIGVTGPIAFDGPLGENKARQLQAMRYSRNEARWTAIQNLPEFFKEMIKSVD